MDCLLKQEVKESTNWEIIFVDNNSSDDLAEFLSSYDEKRGSVLQLGEIFRYKDLFLTLAYRDFKVRYAQTALGFLWALIQPGLTLLIFAIVFGRAAKVDTGDIAYPVFAVVGMSAWNYFAFVMGQSGGSIIGAQAMIKKIYFPRLVIPLAKALVGLVDYFITILFMVIIMFLYQESISSNVVFLPGFVILNMIAALAIGIWLSALS
ncbi:MAG: hypothetical protein AAFN93_25835, partial [Bacteroidota bacterium]